MISCLLQIRPPQQHTLLPPSIAIKQKQQLASKRPGPQIALAKLVTFICSTKWQQMAPEALARRSASPSSGPRTT